MAFGELGSLTRTIDREVRLAEGLSIDVTATVDRDLLIRLLGGAIDVRAEELVEERSASVAYAARRLEDRLRALVRSGLVFERGRQPRVYELTARGADEARVVAKERAEADARRRKEEELMDQQINALARGPAGSMALQDDQVRSIRTAAERQAEIQARTVVAMNRPRDPAAVAKELTRACEFAEFAEQAMYRLPRNEWNEETRKKERVWTEGLSIGFAKEAMRAMGHMTVYEETVAETETHVIVRVIAIDLQTNTSNSEEAEISRLMERGFVEPGAKTFGERKTDRGRTVYTVRAEGEDWRQLRASRVARVKRNVILSLIPATVRLGCERQIRETLEKAALDPKAILARLAKVGATKARLKAAGYPADPSKTELVELAKLASSLEQGEVELDDAFPPPKAAEKKTEVDPKAEAASGEAPKPDARAELESINRLVAEVNVLVDRVGGRDAAAKIYNGPRGDRAGLEAAKAALEAYLNERSKGE